MANAQASPLQSSDEEREGRPVEPFGHVADGRGDEEDYDRLMRNIGGMEPGSGRNGGGHAAGCTSRAVVGILPDVGVVRVVTIVMRAHVPCDRMIVRAGRLGVIMMRERTAQIDARGGEPLQGHRGPEQEHEQQAFERIPHAGADDAEIFDVRQRKPLARLASRSSPGRPALALQARRHHPQENGFTASAYSHLSY